MGLFISWVHLSLLWSFELIAFCVQFKQRVIWSHWKKKIFFFEHAEASSPDSKLSLIVYSPSDSNHSITLMIDARCSGRISSNKPSVMLYANRCCLLDMRLLSIVFDSYISIAKLRNYFHNALVHKQLNWSKK